MVDFFVPINTPSFLLHSVWNVSENIQVMNNCSYSVIEIRQVEFLIRSVGSVIVQAKADHYHGILAPASLALPSGHGRHNLQ